MARGGQAGSSQAMPRSSLMWSCWDHASEAAAFIIMPSSMVESSAGSCSKQCPAPYLVSTAFESTGYVFELEND
jgi:hypothetical protein